MSVSVPIAAETQYTCNVQCTNCLDKTLSVNIDKGQLVADFLQHKKCSKCGIDGRFKAIDA